MEKNSNKSFKEKGFSVKCVGKAGKDSTYVAVKNGEQSAYGFSTVCEVENYYRNKETL